MAKTVTTIDTRLVVVRDGDSVDLDGTGWKVIDVRPTDDPEAVRLVVVRVGAERKGQPDA